MDFTNFEILLYNIWLTIMATVNVSQYDYHYNYMQHYQMIYL